MIPHHAPLTIENLEEKNIFLKLKKYVFFALNQWLCLVQISVFGSILIDRLKDTETEMHTETEISAETDTETENFRSLN